MKKLNTLTYEEAKPETQKIFDALKKKVGKVPNLYATIANSPVALEAILNYGEKLKSGEFTPKEVEAIALSVSQENECHYCLSAHTAVGQIVGFTIEETIGLRSGNVEDSKLQALVRLAKDIASSKGWPQQQLIDDFLAAGYSKAALVELIGFVSLNVFNNYLNHIAETEVDFPAYPELEKV